MLLIFFTAIFTMLLAKTIFKFHAWGQKCHFGNFAKMALCIKIFLAKSILLKYYGNGNKKKSIYARKSTKREFSKKDLVIIEFFFLF
jgi:hypothetical protein